MPRPQITVPYLLTLAAGLNPFNRAGRYMLEDPPSDRAPRGPSSHRRRHRQDRKRRNAAASRSRKANR